MLINTNNTSQAPESKTETIQLSPLEKTLLVNGRMDVALAAVKRMFVVTPDDETLEWIADRLYRQPYTSDVVMSVLPTIAIILHLTPHWTAKRLFEVGPRECQDFCVWGGYSRGSPTRLPFVFEMQYARPGALAREV